MCLDIPKSLHIIIDITVSMAVQRAAEINGFINKAVAERLEKQVEK